ncbi:RcnB family protein [Phenylobacterium sp.]|uniref:RcnB family protein n=1 Tax=Phenylobacterium sp. TaxID=1871053 RepID=UPI0025D0D3B0|nr:RcnB family protein [Phenylobacterium sp.]
MRRLIALLAAVAIAAGPLAAAGSAMGKDRREVRREQAPARGEAPRWAQGRQAPAQGQQAYRGEEYRSGGGSGYDPRSYPQAAPQADPRMNPRYGYRADPRYDPRVYAAPPAYGGGAAGRGGYLGPRAGGEVIQDPGRFRLRPAPRGYSWVRTARGMALVSQSTGQVFDVVPY